MNSLTGLSSFQTLNLQPGVVFHSTLKRLIESSRQKNLSLTPSRFREQKMKKWEVVPKKARAEALHGLLLSRRKSILSLTFYQPNSVPSIEELEVLLSRILFSDSLKENATFYRNSW